jgi:hypothetical protein
VTANGRAFRVLVRNEMFRRVQMLARRDWAGLAALDADTRGEHSWDSQQWATTMEPYWAEHDSVGTGPDARGPDLFLVEENPSTWRVTQRLDDPSGFRDWALTALVDLAASDEAGVAVLRVESLGEIGR